MSSTTVLYTGGFHLAVVKDGGASRHLADLTVPKSGYMVSGVLDRDGHQIPEQSVELSEFSDADVAAHMEWLQTILLPNPGWWGVYQGAWVEGDNVVLDASEMIGNKRDAIRIGKRRKQRAIYDVKKGEEVTL